MQSCLCCSGPIKKSGQFSNRNGVVQRFRCIRCGKSFSELQPLQGLRVDFDKACQVVSLLCEGMGIRAVARLTDLHRDTVLSILETAGQKFAAFLDAKVRNVKAEYVQVDEIHTTVYSKQQNTTPGDKERGEFFTYMSIERGSKLIINWHTSKRDSENTELFMRDLLQRVPDRFQLTTDCFNGYTWGRANNGAVRRVFGESIDYSTEKKIFGRSVNPIPYRYSPLVVTGIKRQMRLGTPDLTMGTTCHAERTNLSVRTFTRRFTRCTIGYSKKLANLRHAVAMFVCHFNFCRKHSAHGQTPAMAAGLTDRVWKVGELLSAS